MRHFAAAVKLAELLEQYWKLAKDTYADIPEDFSLMVLTIMEIWIALDKCALQYCALLQDYNPGFPSSLFDPLLLPWRSMMERLGQIEQYLIQRKRSAILNCPSIFKSVDTSQSFPVRYFDSSPEHQNLKQHIEWEAHSERRKKMSELKAKLENYHRLMGESHTLSCQFVHRRVRGREVSEHATGCRKCVLKSQAQSISIGVHEWPLSSNELQAKAAVFELDVPAPISQWRNATYKILVDILSPRYNAGKSSRRKSGGHHVHSIHEYAGLTSYSISQPGRLQLMSSTKPFVISHYANQKVSVASEETICVKNGLIYALYDATMRQTPNDLLDSCDIRVPCTMKLPPGPYKSLQYAVDNTVHTANEVIANLAQCPEKLTVHEYFAFASLRSGCRLQWRNIARELIARTLNFECQELYILILQSIWQVGPGRHTEICRDSHCDLQETSFVDSLLAVLEQSLSDVEENWRGVTFVRTLVTLASRILTFSAESLLQRCCIFLKRAQITTLRWTRELRDKLHHAETEAEAQNWNERVLEVALTCYSAFDVDPSQLSHLIASDEDLAALAECAIVVHDRCPALEDNLPNSIKMLLRRARRLAHCLEVILRERVLIYPRGLHIALHRQWTGYPAKGEWKALRQPNERWLVTDIPPCDGALSVTIHFNLLTGSLLINGLPLARLPSVYESHPLYQRLFDQVIQHLPICFTQLTKFQSENLRCSTIKYGGDDLHS